MVDVFANEEISRVDNSSVLMTVSHCNVRGRTYTVPSRTSWGIPLNLEIARFKEVVFEPIFLARHVAIDWPSMRRITIKL